MVGRSQVANDRMGGSQLRPKQTLTLSPNSQLNPNPNTNSCLNPNNDTNRSHNLTLALAKGLTCGRVDPLGGVDCHQVDSSPSQLNPEG